MESKSRINHTYQIHLQNKNVFDVAVDFLDKKGFQRPTLHEWNPSGWIAIDVDSKYWWGYSSINESYKTITLEQLFSLDFTQTPSAQWVRVEDELPPDDLFTLLRVEGWNRFALGRYMPYDAKKWFCADKAYNGFEGKKITHWLKTENF